MNLSVSLPRVNAKKGYFYMQQMAVQAETIGQRLVLTSTQAEVLDLLSEGQTINQAARQLGLDLETAKTNKADAIESLGAPNPAVAVAKAISAGYLQYEEQLDQETLVKLSQTDKNFLRLYASGLSYAGFERATGVSGKILFDYHDRLLEKLNAWTRPHSVRRGFELGILSVNDFMKEN